VRAGCVFPLSIALLLAFAAKAATEGAKSSPEAAPIITHHELFAIPYKLDLGNDPSRQPVEVQLFVSTDRGVQWRFYTRVPPSQRYFMFRAPTDGEYWFAVRTVDRFGRTLPEKITAPGLRVLVDTRSSEKQEGLSGQASPNAAGGPALTPSTSAAAPGSNDSFRTPAAGAGNGSVAIAINPPIGNWPRDAAPTTRPVSGRQSQVVNSRCIELEYDLQDVGPSGVGRVELWGTRDGGQSWTRFAVDEDGRSPIKVNLDEEGLYGFRIVVSSGVGLGGEPPASGEQPEIWVEVDLTPPRARLISAEPGRGAEAAHLIISWQADDRRLAPRPITLLYSESSSGPWLPLVGGLENTGRYAWPINPRVPPRVYLRLEVRDAASNMAADELPEPVILDRSRPTARVRGLRPLNQ